MDRLISAGHLKAKLETQKVFKRTTLTEYECGYNRGLNMAAFCLANIEAVDAIPVEWIQRYANACEAVSETVGGVATKLSADAVNVMLDYWKEEQKGN